MLPSCVDFERNHNCLIYTLNWNFRYSRLHIPIFPSADVFFFFFFLFFFLLFCCLLLTDMCCRIPHLPYILYELDHLVICVCVETNRLLSWTSCWLLIQALVYCGCVTWKLDLRKKMPLCLLALSVLIIAVAFCVVCCVEGKILFWQRLISLLLVVWFGCYL